MKLILTIGCALLAGSSGAVAQVSVTTADGNGADAYISNDTQSGAYQSNETPLNDKLIIRNWPGTRLKISMLRFQKPTNLVNYEGSTINMFATWLNSLRPINVWGLKDGDVGENWVESTITFDTAPGVINTATNGALWEPDTNRLVFLGTMPAPTVVNYSATPVGGVMSFADFLAADTDGLVTFYLDDADTGSNGNTEWETKEGSVNVAEYPFLNMPNAFPNPGYPDLTWRVGSDNWTNNGVWNDGVGAANYQETNSFGSAVTLDDTASGLSPITITLDSTVSPQSFTVNATKDYTITGTGQFSGGTGISKSGSGTLTLNNSGFSGFSGAIDLNDGVIEFSTATLGTFGATPAPINFNGGTLRYSNGNLDDISVHLVTFNSDATIEVQGTDNPFLNAPIGNGGAGGLRKTGTGTLSLTGTHTYTGITYVDAGKLEVSGATLDGSPSIVVASGAELAAFGAPYTLVAGASQSLAGEGLVTAALSVPAGTSVSPGINSGDVSTLTIGNSGVFDGTLSMDGGTLVIDISSSSNDVLIANNSLTLNGGTILLQTNGVLANGTYTLIQYENPLMGALGNISVSGFSQPGTVAFLDDSTPGQIQLIIAPLSSKNLAWVGDGSFQLWDVGTSANWTDGSPSTFNHGDEVTFDDSGINAPDIALGALVFPSEFTVNNPTKDYRIYDSTFSGGGKVGGSVGLTKSGSGKLTIDSPNSNSGATTINAGTVEVGTGGKLGTGVITNNASLVFGQSAGETHSSLTGSGDLAVNGTGAVTFAGGATHTGTTSIGSGANLVIGNGGSIGAINSSSITNNGTLTINTSDTLTAPAVTGTGALAKSGSGTLNLGASGIFQGVTVNADGGLVIAGAANQVQGELRVQANATFDLNGFDQNVGGLSSTLFAGGIVTNSAATTNTLAVTVNGGDDDATVGIHGPVQFVKLGTSELVMRADASTYTGGTIVGEGTLQGRGGSGSGFFGTGSITLSNGVALQYDNFPGNTLTVVSGATATLRARSLGDGWSGDITSEDNTSTLVIGNGISAGLNNSQQFGNFTGTVLVSSNAGTEIRFSSTSLTVNGGDQAKFELQGPGLIETRNGTSEDPGAGVFMGSLSGDAGARLLGASSQNRVTRYVIGGNNLSTTYAGTVGLDAGGGNPVAIMKVGTGTLTLSGTNRYEATTRVDDGILVLTGTEANPTNTSAVEVNAPGTLDVSGLTGSMLYLGNSSGVSIRGDGTITGNVVVDAAVPATTVVPGNSAGLLTISGNLTVPAATTFVMELDNTNSPTADRVSVGGTFSAAGATVTVTNIGPMLSVGQIFTLFNAGVSGVNTVIATNDAHATYVFDDRIATAGEIEVLAVTPNINSNPTNITFNATGGDLNLSWPEDHTGWVLQVQTNTLSAGLSTNWFNVPNSSTTNSMTFPVDPANPTVFFRLVLP